MMRTKQIGPLWFVWHWQNLDDSQKVQLAEDALMRVLRKLGVVSDANWREISEQRRAFHDALSGELGHGWRNGRAWLTIYADDPDKARKSLLSLQAQWLLLKRQHSIGASLDVGTGDSNDEVLFSIRVPLFGLYVSCDGLPKRLQPKTPYKDGFLPAERELGATFHDGCLWLKLWSDPHEWDSRADWRDARSKVRQPVLHIVDRLLGTPQHMKETIDTLTGDLLMPEGRYIVTATLERSTWKRARWPKVRTQTRVHIAPYTPIPIPGKGESAWDCDDDAVYESTVAAPDIQTGAHQFVADIVRRREEYGGVDWKPDAGWPDHIAAQQEQTQ